MNTERYLEMQRIQANIRPEMQKIKMHCEALNDISLSLLSKKLSSPSVRSYFVYFMSKYVRECAKSEQLKLRPVSLDVFNKHIPFLAESIMSVMYLHNQVFDTKGGVEEEDEISENILGANLLKDNIFAYVDEHFDASDAILVHKALRTIFNCVDVGQYYDRFESYQTLRRSFRTCLDKSHVAQFISTGTAEEIIKELSDGCPTLEWRIRNYFKRNYLISGALFCQFTEMICDLLNYDGRERENCLHFAEAYGLLMQLVNDNADFVLEKGTASKSDHDVQKDLDNQIITLPLMLHHSTGSNGLVDFFVHHRKHPFLKEKHNQILKEMILSGALPKAVKAGIHLANCAKEYLNDDLPSGSALTDLLSLAYNNRYYYHIFQAKKLYLKKKKVNEIYRCEENINKNQIQ